MSPKKKGLSQQFDNDQVKQYERLQKLKKLQLDDIWLNAFDHGYEPKKILGAGSFGTVCLSKCTYTGQTYAVKLIKNFAKHEYSLVKVVREIQILRLLEAMQIEDEVPSYSPGLIDLFFPDSEKESGKFTNIFLVMEASDIDLKSMISISKDGSITPDHLKIITYNLLCCLKYLHSSNIIHRDIKPSNILINENC